MTKAKVLTSAERAAERLINRAARCLPHASPGLARRARVQLRLAARKLITDVAGRYSREVLAHRTDRDALACAGFFQTVAQQACTPQASALFAKIAHLSIPPL